jgi:hypothetical protein
MGWGLAIWGGLILTVVLMVCAIIAGALELYDKRTVFVIEARLPDKTGTVHRRLRSAINILFRLVLIATAGMWLWVFSGILPYLYRRVPDVIHAFTPGGKKVEPIVVFMIFVGGVIGPGLAVAATMLAASNKYLVLAILYLVGAYFFSMMSIG